MSPSDAPDADAAAVSLDGIDREDVEAVRATLTGETDEDVYLLTEPACPACAMAKLALDEQIRAGNVEQLNIQESDRAAELLVDHGVVGVPAIVAVGDEGARVLTE
jgi:glutaredoxin